jgi:hypothetical protein
MVKLETRTKESGRQQPTRFLQRRVMVGWHLPFSHNSGRRGLQLSAVTRRISSTFSTSDIHMALTCYCFVSAPFISFLFTRFLDFQCFGTVAENEETLECRVLGSFYRERIKETK